MTSTLLTGTVQQGGTINRIPIPNVAVTVYQAGPAILIQFGRAATKEAIPGLLTP